MQFFAMFSTASAVLGAPHLALLHVHGAGIHLRDLQQRGHEPRDALDHRFQLAHGAFALAGIVGALHHGQHEGDGRERRANLVGHVGQRIGRQSSDVTVNYYEASLLDVTASMPLYSHTVVETIGDHTVGFTKMGSEVRSNELFADVLTGDELAEATEPVDGLAYVGSYPEDVFVNMDSSKNEINLVYTRPVVRPDEIEVGTESADTPDGPDAGETPDAPETPETPGTPDVTPDGEGPRPAVRLDLGARLRGPAPGRFRTQRDGPGEGLLCCPLGLDQRIRPPLQPGAVDGLDAEQQLAVGHLLDAQRGRERGAVVAVGGQERPQRGHERHRGPRLGVELGHDGRHVGGLQVVE